MQEAGAIKPAWECRWCCCCVCECSGYVGVGRFKVSCDDGASQRNSVKAAVGTASLQVVEREERM